MNTCETPVVRLDEKYIPLMTRFGDAFAGERIWLRELLQNARRAGASRISILTDPSDREYFRIEDNGGGIEDFQILLDPGHSNWTEEVLQHDLPFGVGFWSVIDVARRVEVRSKGWRGIFRKGRILAGEPVSFERCEEEPGTTVTVHLKKPLAGFVHLDARIRFQRLLEEQVCGFPVPVYLNGQPVARPYALDVWDGLKCAFPEGIALVHFGRDVDAGRLDMTFYQGLPLGNDGYRQGAWPSVRAAGITVYLHLIGSGWRIKAPDRICLYDSQEVSDKVSDLHRAIKRAVGEHVLRIGRGEERFDQLIEWGCSDLIREYPIPPGRWARIEAPLHLPHYEGDHQEEYISRLPPREIPTRESGGRFLLADSFCFYPGEENIGHYFAAYALGLPMLHAWQDPEHWIWSHPGAETFEHFLTRRLKAVVRPEDKITEGAWRGHPIVICKAYDLQVEGYGRERIEENGYLNGTVYIIDGPYRDYYPIDHAESFETETEDFDHCGYELAISEFRSQLAILLKDYGRLIEWALEKYARPLRGLKFIVEAEESGIVAREVADGR
ncbi:MAG: hypothetical protein MPW15_30220 (plasmid) [Candidatus Manganitrophus sp.]|nr:hypothetical protein [Candidatus Manganitrophus sp.]